MKGLDPVIRAELIVNIPSGSGQVIQMAQRIESKNQTLKHPKGPTYGGNKGGMQRVDRNQKGPWDQHPKVRLRQKSRHDIEWRRRSRGCQTWRCR